MKLINFKRKYADKAIRGASIYVGINLIAGILCPQFVTIGNLVSAAIRGAITWVSIDIFCGVITKSLDKMYDAQVARYGA